MVQFADSPAELASIAHSFKLTSDKKTIFLFADTEEEHMAWRRRIREAVRMMRLSSNATTPEADHETAHDAAADSSGIGDTTRADGIGMEEPSTYAFIGAVGTLSSLLCTKLQFSPLFDRSPACG